MNNAKLFVIDYTLHGEAKSFIIRLEKLDAAEAWHWASCDAGVGRIGRQHDDGGAPQAMPGLMRPDQGAAYGPARCAGG